MWLILQWTMCTKECKTFRLLDVDAPHVRTFWKYIFLNYFRKMKFVFRSLFPDTQSPFRFMLMAENWKIKDLPTWIFYSTTIIEIGIYTLKVCKFVTIFASFLVKRIVYNKNGKVKRWVTGADAGAEDNRPTEVTIFFMK